MPDTKQQGWQRVKLGDIAAVIAGQSPKGENYNKEKIGFPFYQGKKDYGERYLSPPTVWTTQMTKRALSGDILMSVRAPVGALNISMHEVCIGRGLAAIRVKKNVCRDYVYYSLLAMSDKLEGRSGAIFNSISKTQIESLELPLSPFAEQQRIAAKLDTAFAEIDTAVDRLTRKKAEITALKNAVLKAELNNGWQTAKLGDVCKVGRGTAITQKQTIEGSVPVVAGGTKPAYFHNEANREKNCITISGSGANAGFVNIWGAPIFASDCTTIEPLDSLQDVRFIYYCLLLQQQFIYDNFRSGAAQPHVYAKDIAALDFPLVATSEQRRIAAKLDAIFFQAGKITAILDKQLAHYQSLKSAFLRTELQTESP